MMLTGTAQVAVASDSPTAAATGPAAGVSPTSVAFPDQVVGTMGSAQTVTLSSTGDQPLVVQSVHVTGANDDDFRILTDTCSGQSVAPGSNCAASVAFAPNNIGARTADLLIFDNASPPQIGRNVPLSGNGISTSGPLVGLSPTSMEFYRQAVGTTSSQQTVTVTNRGDAELRVSSVYVSGANPGDFRIVSSQCASPMPPGAWCAVSLVFAPALQGTRRATLLIIDNAVGSPHSVALSGTGTVPAVSLSPPRLDFGDQLIGTTSNAQTLTVTSSGTAPLSVGQVAIPGTDGTQFRILSNGCSGRSLFPQESCGLSVVFAPTMQGSRAATLLISNNAPGSPHGVPLSGTGTAAAVALSPTSVDFGDQGTGTTSSPRTVTVTNSGSAALSVSAVALGGANPTEYRIDADTCGGAVSISPGSSCAVSVVFAPVANGSRSAELSISNNAPGSPHRVPLTGNGTIPPAPAVTVEPTTLAFGDQPVGTASTIQTVTVRNSGNGNLTVSAVGVAGASSADFSVTGNTCASGSVAPGASCVLSVTFVPSSTGPRTATLAITDNAPGSPHTVALSGNGVLQADLGVSISATPNPVRTGTTLTYTVTVTNFGPTSATAVVLNETLPTGSKFVSYTASGATTCTTPAPGATGTLTCSLGSLPVGSNVTQITVKVVAAGGSSITNTASVTSTSNDPNPANNTATVSTPVFGRK